MFALRLVPVALILALAGCGAVAGPDGKPNPAKPSPSLAGVGLADDEKRIVQEYLQMTAAEGRFITVDVWEYRDYEWIGFHFRDVRASWRSADAQLSQDNIVTLKGGKLFVGQLGQPPRINLKGDDWKQEYDEKERKTEWAKKNIGF